MNVPHNQVSLQREQGGGLETVTVVRERPNQRLRRGGGRRRVENVVLGLRRKGNLGRCRAERTLQKRRKFRPFDGEFHFVSGNGRAPKLAGLQPHGNRSPERRVHKLNHLRLKIKK